MHIKAPMQPTYGGASWSACAKCGRCFKLDEGFAEGSHLICTCGQNLLLAKMTAVEWDELCEQYPQPASPVMVTIKQPHSPTKIAFDDDSLKAIESLRAQLRMREVDTHLMRQRAIEQCVLQAAYKLGRASAHDNKTTDWASHRIKSQLSSELFALGVLRNEIESIISNLVEAVRNV